MVRIISIPLIFGFHPFLQITRLRKYVETYELKINQLQEQITSKERQLEQNVRFLLNLTHFLSYRSQNIIVLCCTHTLTQNILLFKEIACDIQILTETFYGFHPFCNVHRTYR